MAEPIDHHALMLLGTAPWPFNDPAWGWEVKFDGFRILAFRDGKQARLLTRNGNQLGVAFPEIVAAVAAIPKDRAAIIAPVVPTFLRTTVCPLR